MDVAWSAVAEELLQPYLPLRRIHDVDAPDDLRNAFQCIVDDHGKLVGNQTVPAPNDEVTGLTFKTLSLRSLQAIDEGDGLLVGANSNCCFFCGTPITAGTRVDRTQWPACGLRQVFPRATAGVGKSAVEQGVQGCIVCGSAFALINDVAVPLETIGFQRVENELSCTDLLARRVNVLNTNKPEPVMGPGLQVAGNGGDQ